MRFIAKAVYCRLSKLKQKNNYSSYESYKLMSDITTIPVSKKFHDWLKSQGKKGESYEDILKRLLKLDLMEKEEPGNTSTEEPSNTPTADELLDDNSES